MSTAETLAPNESLVAPLSKDTPAKDDLRAPGKRLVSMDVYRGFVMFLMASEITRLEHVSEILSAGSPFWGFIHHHVSHIEWTGCSLWDMIQPSFTFLAGVSLIYSFYSRSNHGQTWGQMFRHALLRGLALSALGIFLRSTGKEMTNYTFEDTLTQIGMGYPLAFLLANRCTRVQAVWAGIILVGYWLVFALYPLPPAGFDFASVGVDPDWKHLTGFAAHWDKNTNAGAAFDVWFMNLLPRPKPYLFNGGGYLTLSFIPTLGTMILGLLTGGLLRSELSSSEKIKRMLLWGVAGLASGWLLDVTGICPVVKRIWTPSWVLFSGGWCLILLSAFYWVVDVKQQRKWAFPLIVIGMNSIFMYWMAHTMDKFIRDNLVTNLGKGTFLIAGETFQPLLLGIVALFVEWLILLWMYRRGIFLRI
jgi:predicted acyltransferase